MNESRHSPGLALATLFWAVLALTTACSAIDPAVLGGGERAATDYFYDRTHDELRQRFQPVIREKMQEVGLYRTYDRFTQAYKALPFQKPAVVDLDSYLTDEALGGLFTALAEEEAKIRRDPIARTTELLRKVFGRRR